jgi:hypothetical protein
VPVARCSSRTRRWSSATGRRSSRMGPRSLPTARCSLATGRHCSPTARALFCRATPPRLSRPPTTTDTRAVSPPVSYIRRFLPVSTLPYRSFLLTLLLRSLHARTHSPSCLSDFSVGLYVDCGLGIMGRLGYNIERHSPPLVAYSAEGATGTHAKPCP